MKRLRQVLVSAAAVGTVLSGVAQAQAPAGNGLSAKAQEVAKGTRPDQVAFRALYKEMVETDTSITTGSCTLLADKIEAHLREAGYTDAQITRYAVPDHPKEGGLVVVLPGSSKTLKPILLLGHLDVVVAKRSDWTRDPYTLIEEGGYFYGRGTSDMKAMDATWVDLMMRWKKAGYTPKRTVKLAMTCGEETSWAFNGANWLAQNRRDLIDAEFALNEGGGGRTDGHGHVIQQSLHVGEKFAVNFQMVATNPGGHSSIPVRDNAIYEVAEAALKIRDYEFPLMLTDTTKAYFGKLGAARNDAMGAAMRSIASAPIGSPESKAAEAVLNTDRSFHSMLRTTCVVTLVDGGHANNALPQHAGANINCRVFPGVSVESVQDKLKEIIADPKMTLTVEKLRGPVAKAPPLTPQILGPVEKQMAVYFPGVPLVPTMSTGATDGIFLEAVGIPSYGPPGGFGDPDGGGVHGLNERRSAASVYVGRDFLQDLVKDYASH